MLYNFVYRPLPQAGAMQYAFEPAFSLPPQTLPGPGTPYTFSWRAMQPEKAYYLQAKTLQGLVGIVAGQMAHQPLLDDRGVTG